MGLFKPAWMSDNQKKALKVVAKETDQVKLEEIAKNAVLVGVRIEAIKKLTDQSVLADFAKKDADKKVRCWAISKLHDQNVLADIAQNDHDYIVREAAFSKLAGQADQAALIIFAKSPDLGIREAALTQLIRRMMPHGKIDRAAVESVNDPRILMLFVLRTINDAKGRVSEYEELAEIAVSKINDPHMLAELVCDIGYYDSIQRYRYIIEILLAALEKITDEALLFEIAVKAHEYFGIRAVQRITNRDKLMELSSHIKIHNFVSQGGPGEEDGSFEFHEVAEAAKKRLSVLFG